MPTLEKYDVIVIGAGIAGTSLSYSISSARPDLNVLLLERDLSEPDRVVGEFLQPGSLTLLPCEGGSYMFFRRGRGT